jgi:hypothetical protein
MTFPLRGAALLVLALLVAGCGESGLPEIKTDPISGTVTLDGQPMKDGDIMFLNPPDVQVILPVKDGAFTGKAPPGNHRVEIRSYKEVTVQNDMYPEGVTSRENFVAPEFNDESTLKAEVASGGTNQFTFEVKSK